VGPRDIPHILFGRINAETYFINIVCDSDFTIDLQIDLEEMYL
jgi:hypothetical protein